MGIAGVVSGAALGFVAVTAGTVWWLRLVVFVPFWLGALGLLGARAPGATSSRATQRRAIAIAALLSLLLVLIR